MRIDAQFGLGDWSDAFRADFAAMHADPEVMADLGGPLDRRTSDAKFDRYVAAWDRDGIGRWPIVQIETRRLVGYVGVMWQGADQHPLGPHHEIGWRLRRAVWGHGLATRGATLALADAWSRIDVPEIVSYAAPDNVRSQRVMGRLGLRRDAARDFVARYPRGVWRGMLWVADRAAPAVMTVP
jgi:RimJ/RimL family protein N-acetyltransferase